MLYVEIRSGCHLESRINIEAMNRMTGSAKKHNIARGTHMKSIMLNTSF